MNKQSEFLLVDILMGVCVAIGIWNIIDKDFITQIFGLVLFGLGLGGLFVFNTEHIIESIKQQNSREVKS